MSYKRKRVTFLCPNIIKASFNKYYYKLDYHENVCSYRTVLASTIDLELPYYACWINLDTAKLGASPTVLRYWKYYQNIKHYDVELQL